MDMNHRYLNYESYSAEDFAADQDFVQWVKKPDAQRDQFWEAWLKEHPHQQIIIDEARALVRSIEFSLHPDAQEAVQNIWEKINATNARQPITIPNTGRASAGIAWWKMAAALTAIIMVAGVLVYTFHDQPIIYRTAFGETRQITLPDGSVVTLNANSTLKLGAWEEDREVWLQGEAYFSVQKMTSASNNPVKFTVHTNTLDVNVLGTEFTVSERSKTMVVLNEGKIELALLDQSIVMKPGDMVEVSGTQNQLVQRRVDPRVYSAWKDKEWVLDGLSLKQIAERIEETYGLKVVIKRDPDPRIEVSGVVPTDNLETLLKALSAVFDRQFTKQGNEVLIE